MYKYKLKIEKFYIGHFDKSLKKDGKRVIEAFFVFVLKGLFWKSSFYYFCIYINIIIIVYVLK